MSQLVVDGADRRVAALYAFAVAGIAATAALTSHPLILGPVPWSWWVTGGVVCGALNTILPLRRGAVDAAVVYALFWVVPAAWVGWGHQHGVFHGRYWLAGAGLTAVCVLLAYTCAMPADFGLPMQQQPTRRAAEEPVAGQEPPPDEWAERIRTVTKGKISGIHQVTVHPWDTGHGYTVFAQMPPDGSTWETLQPYEAALAAALGIRAGGGVSVKPDLEGDAASVRVDVLEQDAMAGSMTYPGMEDED